MGHSGESAAGGPSAISPSLFRLQDVACPSVNPRCQHTAFLTFELNNQTSRSCVRGSPFSTIFRIPTAPPPPGASWPSILTPNWLTWSSTSHNQKLKGECSQHFGSLLCHTEDCILSSGKGHVGDTDAASTDLKRDRCFCSRILMGDRLRLHLHCKREAPN